MVSVRGLIVDDRDDAAAARAERVLRCGVGMAVHDSDIQDRQIPTLHLARQKIQLLTSMDLGDRVFVLLNRAQKRPIITPQQIEQLLGVPVFMEFPNDYQGVHQAVASGREVDKASELGRQFTKLSYSLMETTPARLGPAKKKKFLEYFSLSPARMRLEPQRK